MTAASKSAAATAIPIKNLIFCGNILDISYIRIYSLTRLAEYCKKKGYKTLQGNDFSKQALKSILTNDFMWVFPRSAE